MIIIKANNLACPIDGESLVLNNRQLMCENGHSFDLARQGYVNLLPVQHKRSKHPGDSKEMVSARTRFLNTNIYEPIANKLADISLTHVKDLDKVCFMDAGCGEGYYFDYIYQYLLQQPDSTELTFIGLDISKYAIIDAAKRNKNITWLVGTNRQPPLTDNSVDIILCVFGFQSFDGFSKILKRGGKIILVEAGIEHLTELREIIYPEVKKSEPPNLASAAERGYTLIDTQTSTFKTRQLDNPEINQLLLMTPHFFRASKEGQEAAMKLQQLSLTVDVVFRVLEKT